MAACSDKPVQITETPAIICSAFRTELILFVMNQLNSVSCARLQTCSDHQKRNRSFKPATHQTVGIITTTAGKWYCLTLWCSLDYYSVDPQSTRWLQLIRMNDFLLWKCYRRLWHLSATSQVESSISEHPPNLMFSVTATDGPREKRVVVAGIEQHGCCPVEQRSEIVAFAEGFFGSRLLGRLNWHIPYPKCRVRSLHRLQTRMLTIMRNDRDVCRRRL